MTGRVIDNETDKLTDRLSETDKRGENWKEKRRESKK